MNEKEIEKSLRSLVPACAAGYVCLLPKLKRVARAKGYALGVHGSLTTDLDLIACPWAEDAASAEDLVEALRAAFGGVLLATDNNPTVKPHGRRAWSIHFSEYIGGPYLDVSVMPRAPLVTRSERRTGPDGEVLEDWVGAKA